MNIFLRAALALVVLAVAAGSVYFGVTDPETSTVSAVDVADVGEGIGDCSWSHYVESDFRDNDLYYDQYCDSEDETTLLPLLVVTTSSSTPVPPTTVPPTRVVTDDPPTSVPPTITSTPAPPTVAPPTPVPTQVTATPKPPDETKPTPTPCKNINSGKDGTPLECNAGGGQERNQ